MFRRGVLSCLKNGSYLNSAKFQIMNYSSRKTHHILLAHTIYDPPNPSDGDLDCPVMITHGLLGSKQNWSSIAKAMARSVNKKVITFDARNHGDSPHKKTHTYERMADDVLNLMENLRIDRCILMGHSMGGRTVMTFALSNPERVERLVVVDVSPLEVNIDFSSMKIYVHALRELQIKYEGSEKSLSEIRRTAEIALRAVVIDPAVRAFLLTNLSSQDGKVVWKPNLQGLLENFDEIGLFPMELLAETFEKPALFIRGQRSLYIPLTDFPRIQKTFVNAQLATVENAGHWPHSENTIHFMSLLLPFVKGDAS